MSTSFVLNSAIIAEAASGLAIDLALITKHLGVILETGDLVLKYKLVVDYGHDVGLNRK